MKPKESGMRQTNLSLTTTFWLYPPWVMVPSTSRESYVPTDPLRQACSSPAAHCSQWPQELTKHPTPTRSPGWYFVTSEPTASTTPAIS